MDGSRACALCGASKGALSCCSACKSVFYCSREHQAQHWKQIHRSQCKSLLLASQKQQQPRAESAAPTVDLSESGIIQTSPFSKNQSSFTSPEMCRDCTALPDPSFPRQRLKSRAYCILNDM